MSGAITTHPSTTNLLQPTKFLVTFPEISETIYFCQKANIPGVTLGMALQETPNLDLFHSGTKLEYNTFDITFIVNEDLSAWTSIYKWMNDLSSVEKNYTKRKENKKQAIFTVMSNLNNPKFRIKLNNIFPLSLSDLEFDTASSAEEHVLATASFRYDWFDLEKVS
jgi:hypothetical protein